MLVTLDHRRPLHESGNGNIKMQAVLVIYIPRLLQALSLQFHQSEELKLHDNYTVAK